MWHRQVDRVAIDWMSSSYGNILGRRTQRKPYWLEISFLIGLLIRKKLFYSCDYVSHIPGSGHFPFESEPVESWNLLFSGLSKARKDAPKCVGSDAKTHGGGFKHSQGFEEWRNPWQLDSPRPHCFSKSWPTLFIGAKGSQASWLRNTAIV